MKICNVTRTSRSNSLPVTPQMNQSISDDATASDCIDHSIVATASTHHTVHPSHTSRTRGAKDAQASGRYQAAIQDEPYTNIQAVETSLVAEGSQETCGEDAPIDIVVTNASTDNASPAVAHRGRLFAKCQNGRRLVQKNGHSKVSITKVKTKKRRYIRDMFTTIMDLTWQYHVILFFSVFVVSWLFFAVVWLALAQLNGDIDRPEDDNSTDLCLAHVYDFSTALLYSLETQTTIGYGYRVIGAHCPIGTAILMIQTCFGIFITCMITGIVFAKIARPKRRAQTIVFSHQAVICMRDGFYNLIFRVGDLRKTHIIGTSIRALLIRSRLTNEGELIPLCQYPLELITESSASDSFVFFFWPVTIAHRITSSSPLWDLSAETMLSEHFEVIVILEGTAQTSGALIQIRTSYVPSEIKWGQRLTPLVTHLRDGNEYEIDFSNFHSTTPVFMPDCSAKEYSTRTATNQLVPPIETEYPHSFTSPSILTKDMHDPLPGNSVSDRLQTLFQRIGTRLKPTRRSDSVKNEEKHVETEESYGPYLSEADLASLPPPPTYASVARTRRKRSPGDVEMDFMEVPAPKGRPPRVRAPAAIHYESEGIASVDGNPVWSRFGGEVNRAFSSSTA